MMWQSMASAALVSMAMAILPYAAAAKPQTAEEQLPINQPMHVVIAHDSRPGCEPHCAEWISAEGKIQRNTTADFLRVFRQLGNRKLPIFINSGGGSVEAGMEIGREIRKRQLDVAVVRTLFDSCTGVGGACKTPPADGAHGQPDSLYGVCASACTIVLAGGTQRLAPAWSHVGVHEIFKSYIPVIRYYRVTKRIENGVAVEISRKFISQKALSDKPIESATTDKDYQPILDYFKEMGLNDNIVTLMFSAEHTAIHWMTREELESTHLTTAAGSGESLLYAIPQGTVGKIAAVHSHILMQPNSKQPITLDVMLENYKTKPTIFLSLYPKLSVGELDTSKLTGEVQLTNGVSFKAVNHMSGGPLLGEMMTSDFCFARGAGARIIRIAIEDTTPKHGKAEVVLDLTQSADFADLLTRACAG